MSWELTGAFICVGIDMILFLADMFSVNLLSPNTSHLCCMGALIGAILFLILDVLRILRNERG